jgi:hypothetical protein
MQRQKRLVRNDQRRWRKWRDRVFIGDTAEDVLEDWMVAPGDTSYSSD